MPTGTRPPVGVTTLRIAEELRSVAGVRRQSGSGLARATGISPATVNRILRGDWAPTTDQLLEICGALDVPMAEVVRRAEGGTIADRRSTA